MPSWRDKIVQGWPERPQIHAKANLALRAIEEGLRDLSSIGVVLHIAEGPEPRDFEEFPKKVFHLLQGEREVGCQAELDELGDNWYPTMQEARQAAGEAKQWQRGGVFDRKGLPAPLELVKPPPEEEKKRVEAAKAATVKEFKESRDAPRYGMPAVVMPGVRSA